MKFSSFFNIIEDSKDLLDFFEQVDNRDQLISRFERLKRQAPDEFLLCLEGLRASITAAMDDTLEMSAALDDDDVDDLVDKEIEALQSQIEADSDESEVPATPAEQNSPAVPAEEKVKIGETAG